MARARLTDEERRSRRRLIVAYHEAGHAVLSLYLGLAVRRVEITPGHPDHAGVCRHYPMRKTPDLMEADECRRFAERHVLIFFAGQLAQAKYTGRESEQWERAQDDSGAVDLAYCACDEGEEADAFLDWLFIRSRNMVNRLWIQIEGVAKALAERGKLTGSEVREIMGESLRRAMEQARSR